MMARVAILPRDRMIVALDVPDGDTARRLIAATCAEVTIYKLGLELFLSGDFFALLDELHSAGKQVFADLKLFDVPNTVAAAVRQLVRRNVAFVTVHGNQAMMASAAEAAAGSATRVLAVTVLTSLDQGDLDDLGFRCDLAALVLSRARRALAAGCAGVVSSGLEVAALRHEIGDRLIAVCPGIRPLINDEATGRDDQKRTVDVAQALDNGADYLVIGRPITRAADPAAAAAEIQRQIAQALAKR